MRLFDIKEKKKRCLKKNFFPANITSTILPDLSDETLHLHLTSQINFIEGFILCSIYILYRIIIIEKVVLRLTKKHYRMKYRTDQRLENKPYAFHAIRKVSVILVNLDIQIFRLDRK